MTMTIGLYVFPDMELLDYAGPYQVFATASRYATYEDEKAGDMFQLVTIGSTLDPVKARAGATLIPDLTIDDDLDLDALIIPGGIVGVEQQIHNAATVAWIIRQSAKTPIVASVCTGAFLLAQTGLLDGLKTTTHATFAVDLRRRFPTIDVVDSRRWVDNGQFVSSAGLSAGIDMALHLVERMASRELSVRAAQILEL